MEKRSSNRVCINDEITIFTKDGYFRAVLENISACGLFLRTNKQIVIGEMIELTIPLTYSPKNIRVDVVAVRVVDDGVAFKFQVIDDNAQSALLHLLDGAYT